MGCTVSSHISSGNGSGNGNGTRSTDNLEVNQVPDDSGRRVVSYSSF